MNRERLANIGEALLWGLGFMAVMWALAGLLWLIGGN